MKRCVVAAIACLSATAAAAPKLACTQDASRTYFCIDENGVRAGSGKYAGLRAARLYSGPPVGGVSDAGANLIVDCPSRVAVMQDLRGVNVGAARTSDTEILRNLSRWICASPKPRPDPKLRQFGPD